MISTSHPNAFTPLLDLLDIYLQVLAYGDAQAVDELTREIAAQQKIKFDEWEE